MTSPLPPSDSRPVVFSKKPARANTHTLFAYYPDADGARIEIVDRALVADWSGFLETTMA